MSEEASEVNIVLISLCALAMAFLFGIAMGYGIAGYPHGYEDGARYMIEESVDKNEVFEARQDHYRAECVMNERIEQD